MNDYLQDLARDYQKSMEELEKEHFWRIQDFRRAYKIAVQQWWKLHNRRELCEFINEYIELNSFFVPLGG